MITIIRRILRDRKWLLITYSAISFTFLLMYAALFPTFASQAEDFEKAFSSLSPELFQAFGIEDVGSFFATFESFAAGENYGIIWPLMVVLITSSLASGMIAGEVSGGQIEIVLSQPINRLKIFISRYIAGLLILTVFVVASVYMAVPLAILFDVEYVFENWNAMAVVGMLFTWAVYGIAMMFSAIFSDRAKVSLTTAFIMVLMYIAKIVSGIVDSMEDLKRLSFFHYVDAQVLLVQGRIELISIWVFVSTIILTFILGVIFFKERDVAV